VNFAPCHPRARVRAVLLAAALALAALAWPASASAAFLQSESSFRAAEGDFGDLRGLATDDAGRVYVADASRGRVDVYDNARNGNAFLTTVGEGKLTSPAGVSVDNRGRIYVADAGRGAVLQFESLPDKATLRRTFTFTPGAEGAAGSPRQLDASASSAEVLVADRGASRIQVVAIKGRDLVGNAELSASVGEVEGVARDSAGRIYVSSDNEENGEVRVLDEKGQVLRTVAPAGDRDKDSSGAAAGGTVNAPKQLARDRLDRIVVADSANDRVQVFAGYDQGSALLGAFGASGSGGEGLEGPTGVAIAPGALLYVADAGNRRIVRLRLDDENGDGNFDAGSGTDRTPKEDTGPAGCRGPRRGQRDSNRDGCADPTSEITAPVGTTFSDRDPPTIIAGRASGDTLGISGVEISLARRSGGTCLYYARGRFSRRGSCSSPRYFKVRGRERWQVRVRLSEPGLYEVHSRATQSAPPAAAGGESTSRDGLVESAATRGNRKTFRIR
jgi:DNA-binding beta-propeller fold protein YncE